MNTAITALDKIYSEVLVKEYPQPSDVLRVFKENLNIIKRDWARKTQLRELVESINRDGYDAWCVRFHQTSATMNTRYATGNEIWSERGTLELMCEAEAIWTKEKNDRLAKEAEEARLEAEPLRLQKMREEELLTEARRRLAEAKREQAIQALMASLTDEKA